MSETPLRQLLASFVVEVDKAGALAKGNAQVDALKRSLEQLQAAAKPAAQAVGDAFASSASPFTRRAAAKLFTGRGSEDAFLQLGQTGGPLPPTLPRAPREAPIGPQFGPTRESMIGPMLGPTRQTYDEARAAAEAYARTLRGKLAGAVQSVRDSFNRGGESGGGGGGLLASLSSFRTQLQLLAGSAVVVGIKRVVEGIGDIKEGAQRLGISTTEFQRLDVLARQSGTTVDAVGTAFRRLSHAAVEPTKQTSAAFTALGVQVKDGSGKFKSANDLFFDTTVALAGVTDETKRNAYAQDLLGRSALSLKPLFSEGTEAVKAQREALAKLNVISPETIDQAHRLTNSWKEIGPRFLKAAEPLLKVLIPALQSLTDWVIKSAIPSFERFVKHTDFVARAITLLAGVLYFKLMGGLEKSAFSLGKWAKSFQDAFGSKTFKEAIGKAAQLAAQLELLDDLITFLRGGKSETGEILDAIFGKGTAEGTQKAVKELTAALIDLWQWFTGKGQGEKAKQLFAEISAAVTGMTHDLLHFLGLTRTGATAEDIAGATKTLDAYGNVLNGDGTIAVPAYGPPTAEQAAGAGGRSVTIGDTTIDITMGQSASAQDVGRAVSDAIAERNRLIAPVATF